VVTLNEWDEGVEWSSVSGGLMSCKLRGSWASTASTALIRAVGTLLT
jgi:hypothetical protein